MSDKLKPCMWEIRQKPPVDQRDTETYSVGELDGVCFVEGLTFTQAEKIVREHNRRTIEAWNRRVDDEV